MPVQYYYIVQLAGSNIKINGKEYKNLLNNISHNTESKTGEERLMPLSCIINSANNLIFILTGNFI